MGLTIEVLALLAALVHVAIFGLESIWFTRPAVYRRFGARDAAAASERRLFAFNQGFYNLFLAAGAVLGVVLLHTGANALIGATLVLFSCACMVSAGIVLLVSAGPRLWRAATLQALFPLLAWIAWLAG